LTTEELIRANLVRMEVPPHKLDVTKPQTVQWLLQHLRDRNVAHADYKATMEHLIALAKAKNWLKKTEITAHEFHLEDDQLHAGVAAWKAHQVVMANPRKGMSEPKIDGSLARFLKPEVVKALIEPVPLAMSPELLAEQSKSRLGRPPVTPQIKEFRGTETGRFDSREQNHSNRPQSGTLRLKPQTVRTGVALALATAGATAQATAPGPKRNNGPRSRS
jgi:hypothetical protein